jgi:hypothetical protein
MINYLKKDELNKIYLFFKKLNKLKYIYIK